MGMDVMGAWMGGGGCAGAENFLHCSGSGNTSLRVGDVDHFPAGR